MKQTSMHAVLAAALALFSAPAVASEASETRARPGNCAEVLAANPCATDGEYVIEPAAGKAFTVYCHGMAGGAPAEYLSLAYTGGDSNFSQYTAGGASYGTDVRTSYAKVRIDPATLLVDVFDTTFASSTGALCHSVSWPGCQPNVTWYPYAEAADCVWFGSASGLGNVNLAGTPFWVDDTFTPVGYYPGGSATFSATRQVVDITGGGYCGGNGPTGTFIPAMMYDTGVYTLQLAWPTFAVVAPAAGETWRADTLNTIAWTFNGDPGDEVRIELLKGGLPVKMIVGGTPTGSDGAGYYLWSLPGSLASGTDYQILITSKASRGFYGTSDFFAISR